MSVACDNDITEKLTDFDKAVIDSCLELLQRNKLLGEIYKVKDGMEHNCDDCSNHYDFGVSRYCVREQHQL